MSTTTFWKNPYITTAARLYDRLRERLIKATRKNGIQLRQTHERIGETFLRSQNELGLWE